MKEVKYKCPVCECKEIYKHKTIGEYADYSTKEVEISLYSLGLSDDAKSSLGIATFDEPDIVEDLPKVVICKKCGIVYKPREN